MFELSEWFRFPGVLQNSYETYEELFVGKIFVQCGNLINFSICQNLKHCEPVPNSLAILNRQGNLSVEHETNVLSCILAQFIRFVLTLFISV